MCYCGKSSEFEACCGPYLGGTSFPLNPEQLMRSRYTAYVLGNVDYLLQTTHPNTRRFHRREDILQWSTSNTWIRLEVITAKKEFVHFKAYFRDYLGRSQVHEERSRFKKEHGKWYYLDAQY